MALFLARAQPRISFSDDLPPIPPPRTNEKNHVPAKPLQHPHPCRQSRLQPRYRGGKGIDQAALDRWAAQIAKLGKQGVQTVLVSSGAIAEGIKRLGWSKRPTAINELQAAAAVGQTGIAQAYENAFAPHGIRTAQILLTHDDLSNRTRYLNARSTLQTLLSKGIVPVINENDTVTTDEIKLGDNDTLGALVTNLIEADALVLLTDQKAFTTATRAKIRKPN